MNRWLSLIGMGEDGFDGLSAAARTLITNADIVIGSRRLLNLLPPLKAAFHDWPSPFDPMIDRIKGWKGKRIVILATGDPMNYGVGALLAPQFGGELAILPNPSAFSLAAARLGWSLPEVETISLHGRDTALLEPALAPGAKVLALADGDGTVRAVADRLVRRSYGNSKVTVLEHMGGREERNVSFRANEIGTERFSDLCTIAIECTAQAGAGLLARVPGLPDEAFVHDGQLTKRDVRAITVSALSPFPGALLWDIGAGCGSISIEWMRAARNTGAIALEQDEKRRQMISNNATALGTPGLKIVAGRAPEALIGQPAPHAVFLGGSVSDRAVFDGAWSGLQSGGRFVANAVTLEGEAALIDYCRQFGGELIRIDISLLAPMGAKHALRPQLPVHQWRAIKP
jgi:precorrin-6Y C5,15-methyltransferase (decarboxylating)